MFNPKLVFALGGLLVGVIGVAFGPLAAFIVLIFTVLGWLIGKYVSGEMEFIDLFLERFFSNRLDRGRD